MGMNNCYFELVFPFQKLNKSHQITLFVDAPMFETWRLFFGRDKEG